MCGIAGFSGAPHPQRIAAMCGLVRHRGPDDQGSYASPSGKMNLGHRRLSIIDLDTGHQPMANEDGSVWIVFNGEIYNYKEIADDLRGRHRFSTHSDTEVLLHLYEEMGAEMVHSLNGMFAFALWDERSRRLLLARDRLGVKPLYWTLAGGRLGFASEMKALLIWPEVSRTINSAALSYYLSLRYIPEPATIWKDIQALPPGHVLEWEPGREPAIRSYWSLDFTPRQWPDEESLCHQLEELLFDATCLRMRSDVPVGAYLSGGVDSSLIVAFMRKHFDGDIHTFTLGYADQPQDKRDIYYARQLADRFGAIHHEHIIAANELAESLPEIIKFLDQPFSGVLSTYFLTSLVRKHVKVVLTGDGADDLFASYGHHRLVWPLAAVAEARLRGAADPFAGTDLAPLSARPDLVRRFDGMPLPAVRASFGAFTHEQKKALLSTPAGEHLLAWNAEDMMAPLFNGSTAHDGLNRMLDVDIKTSLPGEVLFFCDRLSMAHGVEARSPFLDYRIAELSAAIPGRLKINGNSLKYILRRMAARHLPGEILDRPKEGFVQPNHVWLCGQLDELIDDLLSPAELGKHGMFDHKIVSGLVAEHKSGKEDHAFRIWTLVMFQMWFRTYMESLPWPRQLTA